MSKSDELYLVLDLHEYAPFLTHSDILALEHFSLTPNDILDMALMSVICAREDHMPNCPQGLESQIEMTLMETIDRPIAQEDFQLYQTLSALTSVAAKQLFKIVINMHEQYGDYFLHDFTRPDMMQVVLNFARK